MATHHWIKVAISVLTLAFASCNTHPSGNAGPSGGSNTKAPQGQTQSSSAAAPAQSAPPSETATPHPPIPPSEATIHTYTLAAGTPVHIHLDDTLSTETATQGTSFTGTLSEPLTLHGVMVAATGSGIKGEVTAAERGGRLNHPAELSLKLTSLHPKNGEPVAISTETWTVRAQSRTRRNVELIGGGTGLGTIIGAVTGKGKGAAIGALAGAATGTAGAALTGNKQIVLAPEARLRFVLSRPATIRLSAP